MSRVLSALRVLALVLGLAALLGVCDGLAAESLRGEALLDRVRLTVGLDLLVALPFALLLSLAGLLRRAPADLRSGLALGWLGLLGLAALHALSRAPALTRLPLPLPLPALTQPSDEPARPIVLISLDTVRADAAMPRLQARADGALRYSGARTPAPWTLPAMASAMTGLPVEAHGAGQRLDPDKTGVRSGLDPQVTTLAERLREEGYVNLAVLTNAYLDEAHGMTRGFDRVADLTRRALLLRGLRRSSLLRPALAPAFDDAAAVTDEALRTLDRVQQGQFFLWIHYIDAHAPYRMDPRDEGPCALPTCFQDWPAVRRGELRLQASDWTRVQALYAAEAARLDQELDRLLDSLAARGLFDRALVLVYADHGEELGDHGGGEHGAGFYEEVVRVPLYLWSPGRPGQDVKQNVSLIDTYPAILAWVGDGGLGPLEPGAPSAPLPISSLLFGPPGRACVADSHKLIERSGALSLFDLAADPAERVDLSQERPEQVEALRACLPEPRTRPSAPSGPDPLGALRALGYVD